MFLKMRVCGINSNTVDIATFDIELKVLGQKRILRDIHSRTFYDFFSKRPTKIILYANKR